MRIDTDVDRVLVEIEGAEYEVAPKTVAVADALIDAAARCDGKPEYKQYLADLEVLLGADAVRRLFPDGKRENIDRMQRIHAGVLDAFEYNSRAVQEHAAQRQRESLEPMSDFLRQLAQALNAEKNGIRRIK